jgi:serine/threonine protein kinase/formylglycine-generating enzyme required for sulfatase activity
MNSDNSPLPEAGTSSPGNRHDAPTVKGGVLDHPAHHRIEARTQASPPVFPSTPPEPATIPQIPPAERPAEAFDLPGYEIIREIARGGMGVIYQARQVSLDRMVALKCLPPSCQDDPERLRRFRIEATAAAKLIKHGIVSVYDVLQAAGTPVLVMPYIEGSDLSRILADRIAVQKEQAPAASRHPWAALTEEAFLERILALLDRVIDALMLLHQSDVLHRDIKPPNILVDVHGDGWLTDFGLARFGTHAGAAWGGTVGTPGYMSPEQWDGNEDIDGRVDVFSLGVTAYQALTLALPYGRQRVNVATPAPAPPSLRNPLVPVRLDAVLGKALHPDRSQRYQSAAALKHAWDRARRTLPPEPVLLSPWRRATRIAAILALPLLTGIVVWIVALLASSNAGPGAGPPPALGVHVQVSTEPEGAMVVFVPLHPDTGEPEAERAVRPPPGQTTPLQMELAPGPYFVEAATADGRFHQVYRQIPQTGQLSAYGFRHRYWEVRDDGTVELSVIRIPAANVMANMTRFEGSKNFLMGSNELAEAQPPHVQPVAAFFLDVHEVTEAEYRATKGGLPLDLKRPRGENFAVTMVSYDEALGCAEALGKRLPTEAEYEWAATLGGTRDFPWGNDKERIQNWPLLTVGQPDYDRTPTEPPVFGLYSNVAEWTSTWHMHYPTHLPVAFPDYYRSTRTVRGGPYSVVMGEPQKKECLWGPRYRHGITFDRPLPGLGFRCARSVQPLFLGPYRRAQDIGFSVR